MSWMYVFLPIAWVVELTVRPGGNVTLHCDYNELHVAQGPPSSGAITSIRNQDEDGLCYATLDIPLRSQRPKKKRVQPSEFSTYSAINTKRM
ncbi:unnamed protein product [Arctogadus glacialis]